MLHVAATWGLSETKRTAGVLRALRYFELDANNLVAAEITPWAAPLLVRRLFASKHPRPARIAFWLYHALSNANHHAMCDALRQQMPDGRAALNLHLEYWLLKLLSELDLCDLGCRLIPADWKFQADTDNYIRINHIRSKTLAKAGAIASSEKAVRCDPRTGGFVCATDQTTATALRDHVRAKLSIDWLSRARYSNKALAACVEYFPELISQLLSKRGRHAPAMALADALAPTHPRWFEIMSAAIASANRSSSTRVNGINTLQILAFKAPDCAEAHVLWQILMDQVENDFELMELIIAACIKGSNGRAWLQSQACIDVNALPQARIRAATIAGMLGDASQREAIERAAKTSSGWIEAGLNAALALYRSDDMARRWHDRFCRAQSAYDMVGSWQMHCQWVDLRHILWRDQAELAFGRADAARYQRYFRGDQKHDAEHRSKKLKKTLFGL